MMNSYGWLLGMEELFSHITYYNIWVRSDNTCDYLVVSCIDFRIQPHIRSWAEQYLQGEKYDYVGFAGSTKELEIISAQVDLASALHQIKKVILVHHEDCGAYGAQGSFEKHTADLVKARQQILAHHPNLVVEAFFLKLSGEFLPVS